MEGLPCNRAQFQQCIVRAYRHGQERQVKARVLVARASIEGYVYRIQDQKRKKDLLLKTPLNAKTMEQVRSIETQEEFIRKVFYFDSSCFSVANHDPAGEDSGCKGV